MTVTKKPVKRRWAAILSRGGVYQNLPVFLVLKKHLDCGKNKYALEQEMLYDKAMTQVNWSMAVVPFLKL